MQYLWVDSLCIIQDGDGGDDLATELVKMGSIYKNSQLTIAAVSSPNSTDGCFIKDKWPDVCLSISDRDGTSQLIGARVLNKKGPMQSTEDVDACYPLLTRAWVLQERVLAPRLLQCNYGEFTFECLQSSSCECGTSSMPPHPKTRHQWLGKLSLADGKRLLVQGVRGTWTQGAREAWRKSAHDYWLAIIESYVRLNLTCRSDVLPAVAGCAEALATPLKSDYAAGMWTEMLPYDLLWHIKPGEGQPRQSLTGDPRYPSRERMAPSWSWASVEMGQTLAHVNWQRNAEWTRSDLLLRETFREVEYRAKSTSNPFGQHGYAHLRIETDLHSWFLRLFCPLAKQAIRDRPQDMLWDLYVSRPGRRTRQETCSTGLDELRIDRKSVTVNFDRRVGDEGLTMETFSDCCSNRGAGRCGLAPIYLLHALHKEGPGRSMDVFLLLKKMPPTADQPNRYQRIGLMNIAHEDVDVRSWGDMCHGRIESHREDFYLL